MLIPACCLHAGYPRVVSSSRKTSPTVDGLSAHSAVPFLGSCIPATEVVSGELRRCGKVKTSKSPEHMTTKAGLVCRGVRSPSRADD